MLSALHAVLRAHKNATCERLSSPSWKEWKLREATSLPQERGAGKQERKELDPGPSELEAWLVPRSHLCRRVQETVHQPLCADTPTLKR